MRAVRRPGPWSGCTRAEPGGDGRSRVHLLACQRALDSAGPSRQGCGVVRSPGWNCMSGRARRGVHVGRNAGGGRPDRRVLIGLLLPAVTSSRRSARTIRCLASLRQLSIVDQIYQGEFRAWHPPGLLGVVAVGGGMESRHAAGHPGERAVPELGPTCRWCTARWVRARRAGGSTGRSSAQTPPLAQADGNDMLGYGIGLSYGMNHTQLPGYATAGAPDYFNAWRATQVRSPAQKIQWVDAIGAVSIGGTPNPTLRYFLPTWGEVRYPPDHPSIVAYRHHGGACVAYYDGPRRLVDLHRPGVRPDGGGSRPSTAGSGNRRRREPGIKPICSGSRCEPCSDWDFWRRSVAEEPGQRPPPARRRTTWRWATPTPAARTCPSGTAIPSNWPSG